MSYGYSCVGCREQIDGKDEPEATQRLIDAGWRIGLLIDANAYYACPNCAPMLFAPKKITAAYHLTHGQERDSVSEKQPRMIPNPLWCDTCEGRGYVVRDAEWEPYAVPCPGCADKRQRLTQLARRPS